MWRYAFIAVFSLASIRAVAESPSLGPILEQYGPAFEVEGLAVPVDKDAVFKAVFDAAAYRDGVIGINTELESVARFINMHARHGVPLRNMDLAVVLISRTL